jgi:hypothetical protein
VKRTGIGPAPSSDEEAPSLPVWKAFVVQFSRETRARTGPFAGRVEHISSGRRGRFASTRELVALLRMMLAKLDEKTTSRKGTI